MTYHAPASMTLPCAMCRAPRRPHAGLGRTAQPRTAVTGDRAARHRAGRQDIVRRVPAMVEGIKAHAHAGPRWAQRVGGRRRRSHMAAALAPVHLWPWSWSALVLQRNWPVQAACDASVEPRCMHAGPARMPLFKADGIQQRRSALAQTPS